MSLAEGLWFDSRKLLIQGQSRSIIILITRLFHLVPYANFMYLFEPFGNDYEHDEQWNKHSCNLLKLIQISTMFVTAVAAVGIIR